MHAPNGHGIRHMKMARYSKTGAEEGPCVRTEILCAGDWGGRGGMEGRGGGRQGGQEVEREGERKRMGV